MVEVEVLLYVHRSRRFIRDGEPRTATSTFTQLLNSASTDGEGWLLNVTSPTTNMSKWCSVLGCRLAPQLMMQGWLGLSQDQRLQEQKTRGQNRPGEPHAHLTRLPSNPQLPCQLRVSHADPHYSPHVSNVTPSVV